MDLVRGQVITKLGEKLLLVINANLAQEGTEVVKIFCSNSGFRFSIDLSEVIFSFTSKIGV